MPKMIARVMPLLILLASCAAPRHQATTRTPAEFSSVPAEWRFRSGATAAYGAHGMIATESETATRVGLDVLRNGGSAVDAAIATVLALAVAYPAAGNVGGGGFMVLRMKNGTTASLDFRETAPRRAERTMFAGARGEALGRLRTGHLAVGVPGTVAGMSAAHRRFGTRPWAELIGPAVRLAESGVVVDAVHRKHAHGARAAAPGIPRLGRTVLR